MFVLIFIERVIFFEIYNSLTYLVSWMTPHSRIYVLLDELIRSQYLKISVSIVDTVVENSSRLLPRFLVVSAEAAHTDY